MMLAARQSPLGEFRWRQCGGEATLVSYCRGRVGSVADVPDRHWAFLEACVPWHECATHFFVHANAYPDVPLAEQPECVLQWEPFGWPKPHRSGKVMVCGHTQQRSGVPFHLGHAVCVDTWAYGGGWLTCLDVTTGCVWQANQRGDRRTAHLDEYRIRQGTCT
jgi:serine/threonine protein phosphatase 1